MTKAFDAKPSDLKKVLNVMLQKIKTSMINRFELQRLLNEKRKEGILQ